MPEENRELDDELFAILVLNFQSSAMISMGKIIHPITKGITRNLNEAKFAIDMLGMISNKTKGNLSTGEESLMQKVLTELRLNYIDEVKKDEEAKKQEAEKEEVKEKTEEKAEEKETVGDEESKPETTKTEDSKKSKKKKKKKN